MVRKRLFALLAGVSLAAGLVGAPTLASAAAPASVLVDQVVHTNPPPAPSAKDRPTKGRPGKTNRPTVKPPTPCTSPCFLYSGARTTGTFDGAEDNMGIYAPTLKQTVTADYHTLGELAVQSADSQQVVEVGWNVDKGVNGDLKTHAFAYHWVNGATSCYNGCGYVDYAPETTYFAGMDLTAFLNAQAKFFIQYSGGNWWVGIDPNDGTGTHWMGYFPGSLWPSPPFTQAGQVQVFGEVAAAQKPTCTDEGNGVVPTATVGAAMGSFNTHVISGGWSLTTLTANFQDAANGYTYFGVSSYSFRYGGGGSPQAVGC